MATKTDQRGVLPVIPEEIDEYEREVKRFRDNEWANPDHFTAWRLLRGVYGQRQPDAQMMRIKIPYGGLTADHLDALGVIARDLAPLHKGHFTTRENMQFHHMRLEDAVTAMRVLGEVGLTSREACGNTVRNVAGCPMAGVCADEPFDISPYAAAYARYFVRHPLTQKMPRKIKSAFSGCARDCAITAIHDVGFIPVVKDGKKGFKMVMGGGTSIMARIAPVLYEFVSTDDYLKVSEAALRVFDKADELRKNRMKARVKFLIDRIGIDEFRKLVEEEMKGEWAQKSFDPTPLLYLDDEEKDAPNPNAFVNGAGPANGHASPEYLEWKRTNVSPQKQAGYNVALVTIPLGDVQAEQFPLLANILRKYAGGHARVTQQQNLMLRWVPDSALHALWADLKSVGLGEPGVNEITDVTSCPGTDSCKLGITASMGLAWELRKELLKMQISDPLARKLHIKMSGCPNGCGQHHIANIGFHGGSMKGPNGNQIPSYELFIGGAYEDAATRFGERLKVRIPAKRGPEAVKRIVGLYMKDRNEGEEFNAFVDRVGAKVFEPVLDDLKEIGPLNRQTIDLYMDWSKTVLYKVERGEGECAI
ncbi:MAG: nitrite/sulfite reductase [Chloroflexi bacterium]|nr:nitrite/sulfite reductase [Chloroflexota bacterium]